MRLLLDVDAVFEEIRKETQPPAPGGGEPEPAPDAKGETPGVSPASSQAVDAAIPSLYAEPPQPRTGYGRAGSGPEQRFTDSLSMGTTLDLSGIAVIHVSPLVDSLCDRWKRC
jgi:hypothetical protein